MPTHAPAYFPGSPPGADPFFDFEAALARKIAEQIPGYPFGYYGKDVPPLSPIVISPPVVPIIPRPSVSRIRTKPRRSR